MQKKLGLVLGGGGAKGYAHIGVLKFLEENNIKPNYVVGTSIGAIVGALYCLGYSAKQIEQTAKEIKFRQLFDITLPKKGLIKGEKIERYLRHLFENKKIEDLQKPFFAVAVDINEFQEIIFNKGDLTKAVRASISIPGIFHPVKNKNRILVDGGVLNNLPIDVLKKKTEKIITVDLERHKIKPPVYEKAFAQNDVDKETKLINVLLNTYRMTIATQLKHFSPESKDILILAPNLEKIALKDFQKIDEGIKQGYECAKKNSKELKGFSKK
ncbi:MAG: patatin-like phospholipase family protein, partial [Candidatus Pacearchaeota archaeon]|nr:patatin-like phospholipase family protein [Candidatus Pacearchaeota archaeon]